MKTDSLFIILAILGSSFWGSWHCAAMCGPIASLAAQRNSLVSYHLGRGLSYILIGAFGGFLGSFLNLSEFQTVRLIAGFLFALILIFMGLQTLRGQTGLQTPKLASIHRYLSRSSPGFFMGFLSIFLPCGWLYSYFLAAVATRSPQTGSLLMLLFWIGGLPALSAVSMAMKKTIQGAPERKRKIAGAVLVAAGLYSLYSFYFLTASGHSFL